MLYVLYEYGIQYGYASFNNAASIVRILQYTVEYNHCAICSLKVLSRKSQYKYLHENTMAAPPPQTFPYDHLFKILIIGDAATGKVRAYVG